MREKILVHCCCGPCATSSLKRLIDEGYEPVLCYGNSNIWPKEENDIRYENLLKVASYFGGLEVIRQDYDHQAWLDFVKGLEKAPDAGSALSSTSGPPVKRQGGLALGASPLR